MSKSVSEKNTKQQPFIECQVCPRYHGGCFTYTVSLYPQNYSKLVSAHYRQGKLSQQCEITARD